MDNKFFPERLDRNKVYECGIFSLYTDKVKLPSGYIIEKYHQIHHHHEGVSIVVFNDKDEILMIREMRYTVGHLEWEIPAGGVEDGESIEEAVRREVMEETGCTVKDLKFLCSQNPSNGMSDQVMHVFGAKVASEGWHCYFGNSVCTHILP